MTLKKRIAKVEQRLNVFAPTIYVWYGDGEPDRAKMEAATLTVLYDYGPGVCSCGY